MKPPSIYRESFKSSTQSQLAVPNLNYTDDEVSQGDGRPAKPVEVESQLRRQLKDRHVAMISIGGVIGTGLFLGTGTALANGGPVGLLLGYIIMSSICFSVLISVGEMITFLPISGGHIALAERFVGPPLSFAMGWNAWYGMVMAFPAEISASAVLIGYWNKDINPAVWITMTALIAITMNACGAKVYGEGEFWFASIKVLTITGLIILGIILDLGGGPDHDRIGFRYWINPGPFAQFAGISGAKGRFLAFWAVFIQAAFSFLGSETFTMAAGETQNPRRNLSRAVKRVYIRILLFYIGGTTIIGLLVPYDAPGLNIATGTAASSPFVIAMKRSGIKALPSIVNACILTSAWSAASGQLYLSSRALYGLASTHHAPRAFLKLSKSGVPYLCVGFCSLLGLFAYTGINKGAGQVFHWLSNTTAIAGLSSWFGICVTYIRFHNGMKVQGYDRKSLPYFTNLQPFAAWYALVAILLITFFSGWQVFLPGHWSTSDFVANYLPLVLFPILFFLAKLCYRKPLVKTCDMDFVTNIGEIEATTLDDPPPSNMIGSFWRWLL